MNPPIPSPSPTKFQGTRKPSKIRAVPFGLMKIPAVHVTQRPFRPPWGDKLAKSLDLNLLGHPIVNHREGVYWVFDGQHRIYALKENGLGGAKDLLECEVYEDLTDKEMADMFLGRNDVKRVNSFDGFLIACTAGHKREVEIRRAVEAAGLRIARGKNKTGDGVISSVSALRAVYDTIGGLPVLAKMLRVLNGAYAGDSNAFEGVLMEAVAMVIHRYGDRVDIPDLASRLGAASGGPVGLKRRGNSLRERTGNQVTPCVAAAIVDLYNRGMGPRAADRLPSWWKDETT